LEVSSDGRAAVSTGKEGIIESIDLATRQASRAAIQGEAGQLRFRSDGKLLLVANLSDSSLTALSIPALQVIAELTLAMKPENLCFTADFGQLFVSGAGMDAIAIVFPYNMLEVDQTVLTGRQPGVMACSERPQYLFVASTSGSAISILNVDSRKVIGLAQVGQNPSYITVTPDSQYALVLDETSGDMAVIHIPAIHSTRSKSAALPAWASVATALFTVLPVGDRPVQAVVVPRPA
jgi:DNA-binding beta-propeller fold protein YncE